MPNTLAAIMPKILASALMNLREMCMMPQLVNGSYSADAARFGSTIDVPVPVAMTVSDVTPSNTPPAPTNLTPTTVQILLNKWKKADFHLTDKDMHEINSREHFLPMQVGEAVRAISNQVNADIFAEYKGVFGYVGTAGTTPFASDASAAVNGRKALNAQLCPLNNRRGVLDFDAEANALALAQFADFDKVGNDEVKIEGTLGRKYGIDWYADDIVPLHTAGTGSGFLINNGGGYAAGISTVTVDTGSGTILVGDVVSFAGHSQTYVVTAALASNQFSFYPALKSAVADNAAVTLRASHRVNLAFHRDAFAFANRPAADIEFDGGSKISRMTDPKTGISMTLELSRQHHQTVWEFSILYGVKLVRPELAVRIAG